MNEGKVNFSIDYDKTGKPSKKTRNVLNKMGESEKINKVALSGTYLVARVVAHFFIRFSGKKMSVIQDQRRGTSLVKGGQLMLEARETNKKEVWIGENRMYLDEDDILHVIGSGDVEAKTADIIKQTADEFLEMVEGKMRMIIDMNKSGKPSAEIRKAYNELGQNEKIGKVALHGMHPVAQVIASFFMRLSMKQNIKFFKTEEEALAWLKE